MPVVSDTSPISNLAIIGRLEVLRTRFEKIWIPRSVDETDGRSAASRAGLRVTGVIGILLRAKQRGEISLLKPELEALRV